MVNVTGVLLAAGGGRRMGRPKALMRSADGRPWLTTAVQALRDGGCRSVVVVLGAGADEARALLEDSVADFPGDRATASAAVAGGTVAGGTAGREATTRAASGVRIVEASDWASGMGASLRTGLASLVEPASGERNEPGSDPARTPADAALIHLVDLPDVGPDVVARLMNHAAAGVLARADYGHGPAHPVLIGREHWPGVIASASGDRGARDYLRSRDVLAVDCADLATGRDIDTPEDL